ncbi:MAG: hypothetical protein AAF637_03215, partial [Pseudomonadota bacterium]
VRSSENDVIVDIGDIRHVLEDDGPGKAAGVGRDLQVVPGIGDGQFADTDADCREVQKVAGASRQAGRRDAVRPGVASGAR